MVLECVYEIWECGHLTSNTLIQSPSCLHQCTTELYKMFNAISYFIAYMPYVIPYFIPYMPVLKAGHSVSYPYICDVCLEWVNGCFFSIFFLKIPVWVVCYAHGFHAHTHSLYSRGEYKNLPCAINECTGHAQQSGTRKSHCILQTVVCIPCKYTHNPPTLCT